MTNIFKTSAAFTVVLMFAACSDSTPDISEQTVSDDKVQNVSEQNISQTTVQAIPEYKIVDDEVKRNIKRTVEVELSSRTNEESLRALAEKIYALSNVKVERTFIVYRIAGEGDGSYWATTHYNPDLKVEIFGASIDDYEKIKNTSVSEGEILGSWMVSRGRDSKVTAYKKDGQVYIQELYDFGPLYKEDPVYESTELDEGIKLQSENGKDHNEYYIINKKGNLEFWSDNSNYYTTTQKV